MIVKEIHHKSQAVKALAVQDITGLGDVDGEIIDTAGYEACELVFMATLVTTVGASIVLYESDDSGMAGATQVAAAEQLGTAELDVGKLIARIGYIGKKRYVRARIPGAPTTDIDEVVGIALLINAMHQPTAEQPAA